MLPSLCGRGPGRISGSRSTSPARPQKARIPTMGIIIPKMGSRRKTPPSPRSSSRQARTVGQGPVNIGLAGAIFTSTQQRLFTLLFGQPDRSFFLGELIELADCGRGAVQRELARLVDVGLVVTKAVGNQKLPGKPGGADIQRASGDGSQDSWTR